MAASKEINRRLVANIRDEPKQMLKPIAGYEREPLLPIEKACEPLKDVLDHELKQNISIAKMNSTEPEYGLTSDESAAIHLYTMEWDEHENSLYMVLNKTLRLADRTKLRPWFKYLKLFLTGIFKLPPTECQTVWRGVSEDLSASYTRGKEFTWWAVSSCTSAISVLESPLYVGTSGPRTIFSIESSSGKSICGISYFQHEDEILLPPGRYLKVIDKSSPAPNLHIIHLREIQPPHPMLADPFDLNKKKTVPILPIVENKQENNPPTTTSVIPKPVPLPPTVEKKQESNPPTTDAIPKSVPIPPIVEKKQENNPPPTTNVIPKPVPPPAIVEKKQESNPSTTNTIPKPVPIPLIIEKKQENNATTTTTSVIPKSVPPPATVEKKQDSNPPTTDAIPKSVPIPPIVEKKQENNPPPTTNFIPKPVPPPAIVEKKQESNPSTTDAIPKPVSIPPIVEKKQENNPPTASAVPKPAVVVTAQKDPVNEVRPIID